MGSIPFAQLSLKDTQASPINLAECNTLAAINGLKTFSSKCPVAPPMVTATSLPITCAQTMVKASGCVGFTFPGIIDEPGSLSGIIISPMPHLGPELNMRTSLPIFIKATAARLSAPDNSTIAS